MLWKGYLRKAPYRRGFRIRTHRLQRSWGHSQSIWRFHSNGSLPGKEISLVTYLGWKCQILEGIVMLKEGEETKPASTCTCAPTHAHYCTDDTCCVLWLWSADSLDRDIGLTCQWGLRPWRKTYAMPKLERYSVRWAAEGPIQPYTKTAFKGHQGVITVDLWAIEDMFHSVPWEEAVCYGIRWWIQVQSVAVGKLMKLSSVFLLSISWE